MFIYPWGDMHSLNLGWFLLQFKEWVEKIQEYLDNGGGTSENLANVIAPVFNAANYYSAGDYVLYNNELYKANQAVNPGTWDPGAWDRCLIVDEMGSGGAGVDNVARLMIAGQYSASFGYQKYAICRYNDKLWMCNTNLPSGGEAWNASHWDEITVGAGLTGLRRSVETLSEDISLINNTITQKADISLFRRIGIIGDSYATGEQYYNGAHHDLPALSWGAMLARESGISAEIYAIGGQSAQAFLDSSDTNYNTVGWGKVSADASSAYNQSGLFIVALGLNDAYSDPTGESVNTFASRIQTIIDNINTAYTNASKIVLLTFKRLGHTIASDDAYNSAIISAGTAKNVPVIDVRTLDYFNSDSYINNYDSSKHPTPDNYAGMAHAVKDAIEHTICNNNYFSDYRNTNPESDLDLLTESIKRLESSAITSLHTVNVPRQSAHLIIIYGGGAVTYGILFVTATSGGVVGAVQISIGSGAAAPVITENTDNFTVTYNSDRRLYMYDFLVYGDFCSIS